MHGRKRAEYKSRLEDPKLSAALALKAQQYNSVNHELLMKRHAKEPDDTTTPLLQLTSKLLQVNPDPSHVWNHRRLLLLKDDFDIETELNLTRACLERNPKAYAAWFHRKWSLKKELEKNSKDSSSSHTTVQLLKRELDLCALLLQHDERNFHCWNYRRFVVSAMFGGTLMDGSWRFGEELDKNYTMGPQILPQNEESCETTLSLLHPDEISSLVKQEWDFCGEKIAQNFSNCSAFHYRSKLLPLMMDDWDIKEELELIQNAIFTEPDDQTVWWYHRFIVLEHGGDAGVELLQEQAELLRDLIDTENGKCKWGLLGLMEICFKLSELGDENHNEEARSCLERLQVLDPDRSKRYQYIMKQKKL